MKVLVIGSGGREHALCWKLSQSSKLSHLFCAPGNAGISSIAELVPVSAEDIKELFTFAISHNVDLTVVGPEVPLAEGICDVFRAGGLRIFGPSRAAAQLEGSKAYAKRFMAKYGIPTGRFDVCDNFVYAFESLQKYSFPVVIKASGLAAGKGVIICEDIGSARNTLNAILNERTFGEAGSQVVIEEYLRGEEASILALTDGEKYACLSPSQDHKRLLDGDRGPNTGGMGAYAPAPVITPQLQERIEVEILRPTLAGMIEDRARFTGCLYLGLMICDDGPKVLEYNVRFGDPETQAVLPMLKSDLLELMNATLDGDLDPQAVELHDGAAVSIVMASGGYPGRYEKGKAISGLSDVPDGVTVFHAGTSLKDGQIVTSGGRVLGVTARGTDIKSALDLAYEGVDVIDFDEKYFRRDIGYRAV
ncbi:phosphoribosylamine--glycine ligase [candidate division LCP-89 bacterium B3_LCP]|uniref:Phosphoribosylamine--glycine ligase n=1 Tax=candidate division LCP-89 bacterium B3_LCP TaxID=2012998 RepID=A0A532V3H0_UNCL8|nr:MAG: phosphoribosylamine--glycine ligase [candidate division LCP-89 bacterium B3_LCP]